MPNAHISHQDMFISGSWVDLIIVCMKENRFQGNHRWSDCSVQCYVIIWAFFFSCSALSCCHLLLAPWVLQVELQWELPRKVSASRPFCALLHHQIAEEVDSHAALTLRGFCIWMVPLGWTPTQAGTDNIATPFVEGTLCLMFPQVSHLIQTWQNILGNRWMCLWVKKKKKRVRQKSKLIHHTNMSDIEPNVASLVGVWPCECVSESRDWRCCFCSVSLVFIESV